MATLVAAAALLSLLFIEVIYGVGSILIGFARATPPRAGQVFEARRDLALTSFRNANGLAHASELTLSVGSTIRIQREASADSSSCVVEIEDDRRTPDSGLRTGVASIPLGILRSHFRRVRRRN